VRFSVHTSEYMEYHIFELRRTICNMIDHHSYTHNLSCCEIKT